MLEGLKSLSLQGGAGAPASALGGTAAGSASFDNSGFVVNYAPSIGVGGGGIPGWLWIAAGLAGVVWLKRKR